MYIETVPNRGSPPAILLREARREGKKIVKRTLANLSHWPAAQIASFRALLKGERLAPVQDLVRIERSLPHGHVEAILEAVRKLGLDTLIASKRCRERDLVLAMIVERLIRPRSKLAGARHWNDTTLADALNVGGADVDELYAALDWLLGRQEPIEKKLAARHLSEGSLVLYDVSSSFYTGRACPLAHYGHDRDGKKSLPIIVYGVMTNSEGCPVAVQVYPGNTGDPTTVPDQAVKIRERFGLTHVVLVGDRGMLTQTQIDELKAHPGLGWISALRSHAIRELVDQGHLQLSLFDEQNLAEIRSPEFPGERLMACFNPLLAEQRRRKREELLAATEKELQRIAAGVARRKGKPLTPEQIGVKVGRIITRYKMAKHFEWTIQAGVFQWSRREESIRREAELDGIYVVRTSEPAKRLSAGDAVRGYKRLAQVERAFRCLKGLDLRVRPIFHRTEDHVRAHILLCTLAYYLEWRLRRAWSELLFEDEELPSARPTRDPVTPARPSDSAKAKKSARQTTHGLPVHSFDTLLAHLATRTRNTCKLQKEPAGEAFDQLTDPTPVQARAIELLALLPVEGKTK
jgi:Transposase DDE domain